MKVKFAIFWCLLALVVAISPTAWAAEEDDPVLPPLPYYGEFFGEVKSIEPWNEAAGEDEAQLVMLENKDGQQAGFIVDVTTYMLTDNELKVGAQATGYFLNSQPVMLIFPPRYQAVLLAVDVAKGKFIKVARFNEELISEDNTLKLNIGENTKIMLFDGSAAPEDLELGGLRLAVFYGATTRSIPAITTPDSIIVLALTDAVPLPEPLEEALEGVGDLKQLVDGMPLVVSGELLTEAPPVYVLENGTVMVPLRAIAEALGHQVDWDNPQVLLDGQPLLCIGECESTLLNGRTFIPLHHCIDLLEAKNAYVFEGQVEINNAAAME